MLHNGLSFWIRRGIIKRVYNQTENQLIGYKTIDTLDEEIYALNCLKKKLNENNRNSNCDIDILNNNQINIGNNRLEKEAIAAEFEKTVLGVLTVFQGKPIQRIMTLLKQMKLNPFYAKITIIQLQTILDKLTNEKLVTFQDGEYKRVR